MTVLHLPNTAVNTNDRHFKGILRDATRLFSRQVSDGWCIRVVWLPTKTVIEDERPFSKSCWKFFFFFLSATFVLLWIQEHPLPNNSSPAPHLPFHPHYVIAHDLLGLMVIKMMEKWSWRWKNGMKKEVTFILLLLPSSLTFILIIMKTDKKADHFAANRIFSAVSVLRARRILSLFVSLWDPESQEDDHVEVEMLGGKNRKRETEYLPSSSSSSSSSSAFLWTLWLVSIEPDINLFSGCPPERSSLVSNVLLWSWFWREGLLLLPTLTFIPVSIFIRGKRWSTTNRKDDVDSWYTRNIQNDACS